MQGKLYVSRVVTAAGNVGHEVVALVTGEAIVKAREAAEDARRRDADMRRREALKAEQRVRVARSKALWDAAESWRKSLAEYNAKRIDRW